MTAPYGVLAPLATAARARPPEPDGVVRAMPVVLHIPRDPPTRTALLEAAARAALAVCLDPRAAPDGEWAEAVSTWVAARIRKIARRARGAHWAAVAELPGVTVDVDGAQVRALLPGPVDDVPRTVARLQIGGTDLADDTPAPPTPGTPVIWVDGALGMTTGKIAAQVGHAAMLDAAVRGLDVVAPYAVRTADPARWARLRAAVERGEAVAVRDGGFTEVAPGATTTITTPG